jgi:hypothetical protein
MLKRRSRRFLFWLGFLGLAGLVFWWSLPEDPRPHRTEFGVHLMGFRDFEFGHNGFYEKDDDGTVTLDGDAYRCGLFVLFVTKKYED